MPKVFPVLTKLVDAQKMHRQHPDSFEVPSQHELACIKPGDYAKVCRHGERFWIKVLGATGKYLIGEVDVPLVVEDNADINRPWMRVRFEHRHIYTIMSPPSG